MSNVTDAKPQATAVPASGLKKFWADFSESRLALFALAVFSTILFIALFAPWISPTNPYDLGSVDIMNSRLLVQFLSVVPHGHNNFFTVFEWG